MTKRSSLATAGTVSVPHGIRSKCSHGPVPKHSIVSRSVLISTVLSSTGMPRTWSRAKYWLESGIHTGAVSTSKSTDNASNHASTSARSRKRMSMSAAGSTIPRSTDDAVPTTRNSAAGTCARTAVSTRSTPTRSDGMRAHDTPSAHARGWVRSPELVDVRVGADDGAEERCREVRGRRDPPTRPGP